MTEVKKVAGLARRVRVVKCPKCGHVFITRSKRHKTCPNCRKVFYITQSRVLLILEPEG